MQVIRASRAGFCMGVGLALKKLETALADSQLKTRRICTLGPIIHNPQVLAQFAAQGVTCLDHMDSAHPDDYILIRAHGVPAHIEKKLRQLCARVEDATCPKVKRAQLAIEKATAEGASLLLFGEVAHPEVAGLISYAKGSTFVFGGRDELAKATLNKKLPYVLAAQTTQDREIFESLAAELQSRLPNLTLLRTICDATKERQEEALKIAREVDIMIVVGGRDSGNTRRLANLARESGIPALHIESAEELALDKINPLYKAGLTAGASTPGSIVDAVEQLLLGHK